MFKKYGPITASFSSFSHPNINYNFNFNNTIEKSVVDGVLGILNRGH